MPTAPLPLVGAAAVVVTYLFGALALGAALALIAIVLGAVSLTEQRSRSALVGIALGIAALLIPVLQVFVFAD